MRSMWPLGAHVGPEALRLGALALADRLVTAYTSELGAIHNHR